MQEDYANREQEIKLKTFKQMQELLRARDNLVLNYKQF